MTRRVTGEGDTMGTSVRLRVTATSDDAFLLWTVDGGPIRNCLGYAIKRKPSVDFAGIGRGGRASNRATGGAVQSRDSPQRLMPSSPCCTAAAKKAGPSP